MFARFVANVAKFSIFMRVQARYLKIQLPVVKFYKYKKLNIMADIFSHDSLIFQTF